VAKPHRHNTRQTKFNRPRTRPYTPNGLGGGSPGFFPDVAVRRTRMPVRRTSRRPGTAKCRNALWTFLNHAPAGSPAAPLTTASTRLPCRPTVPVPARPADQSALTPAVAYDGDLVVSRRTLAPGLVRRADATPCVLLATAPWNRSSQQPAAAALTMRSSTDAFVTKPVTGENIPNLTIRYSYLHILTHRCFIILLLRLRQS